MGSCVLDLQVRPIGEKNRGAAWILQPHDFQRGDSRLLEEGAGGHDVGVLHPLVFGRFERPGGEGPPDVAEGGPLVQRIRAGRVAADGVVLRHAVLEHPSPPRRSSFAQTGTTSFQVRDGSSPAEGRSNSTILGIRGGFGITTSARQPTSDPKRQPKFRFERSTATISRPSARRTTNWALDRAATISPSTASWGRGTSIADGSMNTLFRVGRLGPAYIRGSLTRSSWAKPRGSSRSKCSRWAGK